MVKEPENLKSFFSKCSRNVINNRKLLISIVILFTIAIAIVFVLVIINCCYNLIFIYPENQVSQIANATEKANLINKYRTTSVNIVAIVAQAFGGAAIFAGLIFAWGNLTTAREGQITDRFTRAVDQLGNEIMEVRIGGIYALERIAKESEKDYLTIKEIFNSYIKKNSPKRIQYSFREINGIITIMDQYQALEYLAEEIKKIRDQQQSYSEFVKNLSKNIPNYERFEIKPDIKAITSAITRLTSYYRKYFNDDRYFYDFSGTNLQSAIFDKAHLEKASFVLSSLLSIDFKEAHLENADFGSAILLEANFKGAYLEKTNFYGADLKRANLSNCDLTSAKLIDTNLENANLSKANLTKANLRNANLAEANLEGANLEGASYLTIDQLSKVKSLYNAKLDEKLLIKLKEKYPTLFKVQTL